MHNEVDETFSSKHIRNVSEIGIVANTEQFDEQVNKLMQQHQLEYFSKQQPMKHFRAIGDDEGLFIVVPELRNWYPTNIASGIFALVLCLKIVGKSIVCTFNISRGCSCFAIKIYKRSSNVFPAKAGICQL